MKPSVVVFDIGGVLVDWQPHLVWIDELGSRGAVETFMARADFKARNARADNGARFDDLAAELDDPEDARLMRQYVPGYARAVESAIPGTWELIDRLKTRDVSVHAITNWSAETWPEGLKSQPRLAEVFGVTVISGREGVMKPDARIFHLLCERAGVTPQDCVFVDDGLHNVDGARAVGMDGIHFTGAPALEAALQDRGLL
ncbi:HAD family phosphatase [Aestuariivita sp.]|jgi:FMN phosphatase YigB (HAD superfamily)|uniref:HAD family hydrolase n=1 Tax=Aestuariivita sp. TaxID=1872407 RepID=UPI00216E3D26|nr:HAD family phosphatase [Aestuariivita sp.]MCE8009152.1 HAD family phosphatase [Aestuariivita sp.]